MRHRATSATFGRLAACVAALLALAAGPPTEQPAPGPLFRPERFVIDPIHWTVGTVGVGLNPRTGPWASVALAYAGEHPSVLAWDISGPLTPRDSRIATGTASLVLKGFATDGTAPMRSLAGLLAGHHFNCWAIQDIHKFKPVPPEWLRIFEDKKPIRLGNVESEMYGRILGLAHVTSPQAFDKVARDDVNLVHLLADPEFYRGQVIRLEGSLRLINRFPPTPEAAYAGVNDLYEAWIFPERMGADPYRVAFTDWPAGLPRSLLGKGKLDGSIRVQFSGYFLKTISYTNTRDHAEKIAPFLVGNSLTLPSKTGSARDENVATWVKPLVYAVPIMFVALIFVVVGLTYWLRRTDAALYRRLMSARTGEFIPPPPDVVPVAAPVGGPPPAQAARAIPQRTNLPPRGERRGDSGSPDAGHPRGAGEKPPDEDAGVQPRPRGQLPRPRNDP